MRKHAPQVKGSAARCYALQPLQRSVNVQMVDGVHPARIGLQNLLGVPGWYHVIVIEQTIKKQPDNMYKVFQGF
jgi:hypothetical protein